MQTPKLETTRCQRTYKATITVSTSPKIGSYDDCLAWCRAVHGREVWITDSDGKQHVLGVVTLTQTENVSGY
jgi:hypothetical protein